MKLNTYVFPHPINVFIIKHIGMPVEEFCELHAYKYGTVSSWMTRNRSVKALPTDFVYCLKLSSGKTMDEVYDLLLALEDEFTKSIYPKKRKKYIE